MPFEHAITTAVVDGQPSARCETHDWEASAASLDALNKALSKHLGQKVETLGGWEAAVDEPAGRVEFAAMPRGHVVKAVGHGKNV